MRVAHVVKASDEDIHWLYPDLDGAGVAARWLELGAELVVITAGTDGASAYRGERARHRAGRTITLVDTVGAGDAFMSGLIDALDRRGIDAPKGLDMLDDDLIDAILDDAILVAALTCEQAGANPPPAPRSTRGPDPDARHPDHRVRRPRDARRQ